MEIWQAIVLGVVQGITEFLPISSSGHLELTRVFLGMDVHNGLAFDAVIHLGTLGAVVLYFWRDLFDLVQTLFRKLGRLPVNEKDFTLLLALIVGTIPAAVGGFFLEALIETHLESVVSIAFGLAAAAVLFMYAEWKQYSQPWQAPLSLKTGFYIGLFQLAALIPGLSRSGTTIAGGMLLGLSRYEASRFSFLLAIPITAGAGLKNVLDYMISPQPINSLLLVVGAITSFVLALVVIHFFLAFIRRYTLWPFVWYSLVVVALIAYAYFFVWE